MDSTPMQATRLKAAGKPDRSSMESMPEKRAASAFALFSGRSIGNVTADEVASHAGIPRQSRK